MLLRYTGAALIASVLVVTGCSDTPAPTEKKAAVSKAPELPTGPISALTAFYKMYEVARKWSPDIQPLSLTAIDTDSLKGEEGKFPAWRAAFGSVTKREAATYTYSTVDHDRILRGVRSDGSVRWAGGGRDAMPFENSEIHVDSDAAYKTAAERAAAWLSKNVDKPITTFSLGDSSRFPAPVWYIVWGTTKNGYSAYVNASNGKVLGK